VPAHLPSAFGMPMWAFLEAVTDWC